MTANAPLKPVSHRLWIARQALIAGIGLILLGAALLAMAEWRTPYGWMLPTGAAACIAIAWLFERGRYRSWAYAEREDDLVVRRGLMFRRTSVVPYGRMQFIDVSAGPIDRLFGLATVQLHTAAAATDARIPGLLRADAEQLRDRLAAVGEATATGL